MADGDRSAVPLTKMERFSSKLSTGAKRSIAAAAQVAQTGVESSLTAAAKTKESSLMAASLATQITKGTAEMALGIDDSGAVDASGEQLYEVSPYREVGIEAGIATRDAVICIGSSQQADTVWACGNMSIRVCSIELQRSEVLDVQQYISAASSALGGVYSRDTTMVHSAWWIPATPLGSSRQPRWCFGRRVPAPH